MAKICQPKTEVSPGSPSDVSPAAVDLVLGAVDVEDRLLGGVAEPLVLRQPVGLAEGHRGDGVAVEVGVVAAGREELARGPLHLHQPEQAALDRLLIPAGLACGCGPRRAGAGAPGRSRPCRRTRSAPRRGRASPCRRPGVERPAAVGPLVAGDPVQPHLDGLLGFGRAALACGPSAPAPRPTGRRTGPSAAGGRRRPPSPRASPSPDVAEPARRPSGRRSLSDGAGEPDRLARHRVHVRRRSRKLSGSFGTRISPVTGGFLSSDSDGGSADLRRRERVARLVGRVGRGDVVGQLAPECRGPVARVLAQRGDEDRQGQHEQAVQGQARAPGGQPLTHSGVCAVRAAPSPGGPARGRS